MWWWNSHGYTPAGVEAWNGIRALDYLETRPEVDKTRFGVTGRSGGGAYSWWITAAITFLVLWISFGIPEEHLPWVYLLRFLVIVQGTALLYFAYAAARFPHDLPSYTVGMLYFGTIFVSLLPLILGFSYFLFDFKVTQKLGLTLGIMIYLVVFLPFQYMLHAWIIHKSVLFMPVLYFVFGPFLDVVGVGDGERGIAHADQKLRKRNHAAMDRVNSAVNANDARGGSM